MADVADIFLIQTLVCLAPEGTLAVSSPAAQQNYPEIVLKVQVSYLVDQKLDSVQELVFLANSGVNMTGM